MEEEKIPLGTVKCTKHRHHTLTLWYEIAYRNRGRAQEDCLDGGLHVAGRTAPDYRGR